ncbi:NmrA family NAD(P)-binding protein [Chryseobacterium flavum]|nr:NAD(P)H-binding protein [Chryseobacterium flavum]
MKIVITGALGNIGKTLTEQLVANGHDVIGIGHKPENKEQIESIGAKSLIGSVEDKEFLMKAFENADVVFTMVPPNYSTSNSRDYYNLIGKNYFEAIKQSNVKRVVNVSSWGAHLPNGTGFISGAHDVEKLLDQLEDVSITHLRSGFIYYNLFRFVDIIKNTGMIISNYGGDDKLVLTSTDDIADAAFEEIEKSEKIGIHIRYIASDDRTANEVAKALGDAIGKTDLKWKTITNDELETIMQQQNLSEDVITNTIELHTSIHDGKMREDYDLQKAIPTGKVKLEDFSKEFAKVYNQA